MKTCTLLLQIQGDRERGREGERKRGRSHLCSLETMKSLTSQAPASGFHLHLLKSDPQYIASFQKQGFKKGTEWSKLKSKAVLQESSKFQLVGDANELPEPETVEEPIVRKAQPEVRAAEPAAAAWLPQRNERQSLGAFRDDGPRQP